MGCCSSRPSTAERSPPYPTNQPHASSATPIAAQGQSPRLSTSSRQSAQQRRYLNPAARFNEPLKPHVFASKDAWTPSRLERERRDFFDTRVSGSAEAWNCIKTAVELFRDGDAETAQLMINAAGLTVPTGDMTQGVYDDTGAYYQLPNWVVADPTNLAQDSDDESKDVSAITSSEPGTRKKNEKGKGKAPPAGEGVALKARLSDRATDINLTVYKSDTVGDIVERVKEESGVGFSMNSDVPADQIQVSAKIRLAYMGRLLQESQTLEASGWKEGHVVNAMVFSIS